MLDVGSKLCRRQHDGRAPAGNCTGNGLFLEQFERQGQTDGTVARGLERVQCLDLQRQVGGCVSSMVTLGRCLHLVSVI